MTSRFIFLAALAFALSATASAHVTSYGSSYAGKCARVAANKYGSNVRACDKALSSPLSDRDRKGVLINRGIIHRRNGDLQLALDDFNAAIDLDPEFADAYLNRGTIYYLAGYQDRAIADYERALALGTDRPEAAWYNIGVAYEEMGDKAKAREAYEKALAEKPSYSAAKTRLAKL